MAMQGEELKAARLGLGMTQSELGRSLGLSATFIGLMERGEKTVDPRTAMAVGFLDEAEAAKARAETIFSEVVPEATCELWDYKFRIRCGTVLKNGKKAEVSFLRRDIRFEHFVNDKAKELRRLVDEASD